jgi:hypothetical protein
MLGRAARLVRKPDACLFDVAPDRGYRVSPCNAAPARDAQYGDGRISARRKACPRRSLVSVALVLGLATLARRYAGRLLAAILLYGVRTFLDAVAPRLPDLPHASIVTCDNSSLIH